MDKKDEAKALLRELDKIFSEMSLEITPNLHLLYDRDGKGVGTLGNEFLAKFAVSSLEPVGIQKIRKKAGMSPRTAGRALDQLLKLGLLERDSRKKYRIADAHIEASVDKLPYLIKIFDAIDKASDQGRAARNEAKRHSCKEGARVIKV